MRRGDLVIGQIDGDLRPLVLVHVPADGLAVAEFPGSIDLLPDQRLRGVHIVQTKQLRDIVGVRAAAVGGRLGERPANEVAVPTGVRAILVGEDLSLGVGGGAGRRARHPAALAQLEGDVRRQRLVPRVQRHVVGDEEFAGADHGRASPGVEPRGTKIRRPVRVVELLGQPLVLALSDGRQVLPLGSARRSFVEIDGDGQLAPNTLAHASRDGRAVLHGHAGDRDKGADVSGAHPRVRAVVLGHIYDLSGFGNGLEGALGHGVRVAHEGHHSAVRVRSRIDVQ